MRSHFFVISNCNENHLARTRFLVDHESELKAFREKENHSNADVLCNGFLLHWASISFFAVTCLDLFLTLSPGQTVMIVDDS